MAGYTVGRTFPVGLHIAVDADGATTAVQLPARTQPPPSPTGSVSAGNAMCSIPGWLVFRRIVDIPFEVCAAGLESWSSPEGHDGELLIGRSVLRGPIEHDPDSDTCRIEVRLARGPLRSLLRMRLDIDRWSSSPSSTALELIPSARVRPTASYFRAGHLLLDRLTHRLRPSGRSPVARPLWPPTIAPHSDLKGVDVALAADQRFRRSACSQARAASRPVG
jgi:hypothetical protein